MPWRSAGAAGGDPEAGAGQAADHGRPGPAGAGVGGDADRLVDDDEVVVVIARSACPATDSATTCGGQGAPAGHVQPRPCDDPVGLDRGRTVSSTVPAADQLGGPGAGEAEQAGQRRVEALAGQPLGHGRAHGGRTCLEYPRQGRLRPLLGGDRRHPPRRRGPGRRRLGRRRQQGRRVALGRGVRRPRRQPQEHQGLGRPGQAGRRDRHAQPGVLRRRALERARGLRSGHRATAAPRRRPRSTSTSSSRTSSSLPSSGRDATTAFLGGTGDVLMAYENEAILARQNGEGFDYVIPDTTPPDREPGRHPEGRLPSRRRPGWTSSSADEGQKQFALKGFRPILDDVDYGGTVEGATDPSNPFPEVEHAADGRRGLRRLGRGLEQVLRRGERPDHRGHPRRRPLPRVTCDLTHLHHDLD